MAVEPEKPRGQEEQPQFKEAAPKEQVVYDGVQLSELPQDALYAKLENFLEDINYRRLLVPAVEIEAELGDIASILSKHLIRHRLTTEQNAALVARVRQIRDALVEESLTADDVEIEQIDPDILFRVFEVQKQIRDITELLKNPDFDPGSHILQIALTRNGKERSMNVIQYIDEEQETIKQLYAAGVFDSDKKLSDMVKQGILKMAVLLVLCNERKKLRELQLTEEAERIVREDPLCIKAQEHLALAKDFSKKTAVECAGFLDKSDSILEEIDDKLENLDDRVDLPLKKALVNLKNELEVKYKTAAFYHGYATFGPQWESLLASVPKTRKSMMDQGIDLSTISALKTKILEMYGQMVDAGIIRRDNVADAGIAKIVSSVEEQRKEIIVFIDEQLLKLPDPQSMTLDEVVPEILTKTSIYTDDVRVPKLKNRYEELLPTVTDPYKRAILINAVSTLSAAVKGTSQSRDFAANLNKVIDPFAGDGGAMNTLGIMLMDGHMHEGPITEKEVNEGRLPVDMRAVKMWDFIVDRIKHYERWGGKDWTVRQLLPVKNGETDSAYLFRIRLIQTKRNDESALRQLIPRINGENTQLYEARVAAILRDPTAASPFEYDEEFVVKMEGESEGAFMLRLKAMAQLDQNFSYDSLAEDVVGQFEKMIDLVFADIDPQKRVLLRGFYKTFGAKSAAYVSAHLGAGRTRGHGFKPKETEKKDEAAYCHPVALRMYKATRYERLKRERNMSWNMFLSKEQFVGMVAQSFDSHYVTKAESALELYELYELFCHSRWGKNLPLWMTEARKLFESPELTDVAIGGHLEEHTIEDLRDRRLFEGAQIDLNDRIFPLLPDVVTNVMKVEQQKRDLLEEYSELERRRNTIGIAQYNQQKQVLERKITLFIKTFECQGYFNYKKLKTAQAAGDLQGALRACYGQRVLLGGQDSSNYNVGQYVLAAEAVEKMFDTFDTPTKPNMTMQEAKHTFNDWNDKIIGKAKLTPGRHHLLFAPFTCYLLTNILNSYEYGHDRQKVNELYRILIKDFILVDGVPTYFQEEVVRLMGGDINRAPDYCVYTPREWYTELYRNKLFKIEAEERTDLATKIMRKIPLSREGEYKAPYEGESVVGKETTSDAKDEAGKH